MSSPASTSDVEALIDGLVRKGVAYAVALYPFLYSSDTWRQENTLRTLEPAFGRDIAKRVYDELSQTFRGVNLSAEVVVGGERKTLRDYVRRYLLRSEITELIASEAEKRVSSIPEENEKVLSVACAIIKIGKDRSIPYVPSISVTTEGIDVYPGYGDLPRLVSSVLGLKIVDVEVVFYKYLLGFKLDLGLGIYPFTTQQVQHLVSKAYKYIRVPSKDAIRQMLKEFYRRGEYSSLLLIEYSLRRPYWLSLDVLKQFTGLTEEQLCNSVVIEGVISECIVNPFAYNYVKEVVEELYDEARREFTALFKEVFGRFGYKAFCFADYCTFTKGATKPILIYFYPWMRINLYQIQEAPDWVKAVVVQGVPVELFTKSELVLSVSSMGYLWLFAEGSRLFVLPSTYRREEHYELLKILREHFTLESIGPASGELEHLLVPVKPAVAVSEALQKPPQLVRRFGARDLLEEVVANVLESAGFSVRVDYKVISRAGTEVEVDVWGEKVVGDTKFVVYASCKNWNRPIEVDVVREEFGRVIQLPLIPHVRVIVAPSFAESAKKEALSYGFLVIEVGEKVVETNLERTYRKVYERLNGLFTGIAPRWMQELAGRVRKVAEEIRKLSEELEIAAGTAK